MHVESFFDKETSTFTYIVYDTKTKICAIIDPVLNYNLSSKKTETTSADQLITYIKQHELKLDWILETHLHADHLTAATYLKHSLGGKIGIGNKIKDILYDWTHLFDTFPNKASLNDSFDILFSDEEAFTIGTLECKVIHTPGHTPVCVSYLIKDALFVGDTLLMPYIGTARTDFPGGSTEQLYHSIQTIFTYPDHTSIYTCHDYPPPGQIAASKSTVFDQKTGNILINQEKTRQDYIIARNNRNATLDPPKLMIPAIKSNLFAGSSIYERED